MNPEIMLNWIAENGTAYAFRILAAIIVFIIGRWLARLVTNVAVRTLSRTSSDDTLLNFMRSLVYNLLFILVIVAALSTLGVETTSFAAILAAAGLAIGLALQGSLSNFAAGVMILVFRPYKKGDLVELDGHLGVVDSVQIFNTLIDTPDNKRVIIANATATGGPIVNYSTNGIIRVDLEAGIGYDDDIRQAKAIFMDIITNHPAVLEDPAPTVNVLALADSSVNLAVRPWCRIEDYWDVYFDVTEAIKLRCDEAGITIPYPQRDVHLMPVPAAD